MAGGGRLQIRWKYKAERTGKVRKGGAGHFGVAVVLGAEGVLIGPASLCQTRGGGPINSEKRIRIRYTAQIEGDGKTIKSQRTRPQKYRCVKKKKRKSIKKNKKNP